MEKLIRHLIREAARTLLSEAYALDPNMVPRGIRAWVDATLGRSIRKYKLVQKGEVEIGMPVFEADREEYRMFKLLNGDAVAMEDVSFYRAGNESDGIPITGPRIDGVAQIPPGHVLVRTSRYIGDATLYTAADAQKFLSAPIPEGEGLTDQELDALYQARSLKSAYRKRFPDDVYGTLIGKGLMAGNKSITVNGRNYLEDASIKDRMKKMGFHNIYEAISPEARKGVVDFSKMLKATLTKEFGTKFLVNLSSTTNENPFITVRNATPMIGSKQHMGLCSVPPELKQRCLEKVYGHDEAQKNILSGMGNIRNEYISLHMSQWKDVMGIA